MTKPIKWGILGLGKIAHKFAQDLQLHEDAIIQAVGSRNKEKAAEFASTYLAKSSYGSYEELVEDENVDVIYIATPHVFHYENTLLCLEHNKAVLCEKAFAINQKEVQGMIEVAKTKELFLMEAIWTRFIPAIEKVLEIVRSDEIGDVTKVKANFGFKAEYSPSGRLFNRNLGGGALLDIGIYPVYLSQLILGKPSDIDVKAEFKNQVDVVDDMLLKFQNGQDAHLQCTLIEDTSTEGLIHGKKGKIKIHNRFHHPEKITVTTDLEEYSLDIPYQGNGYFHEINEVHRCLKSGKIQSTKMSWEDSLTLISTLDSIRNKIGLVYPDHD